MAANPSPWLGDKVNLRIQLTEYEKAPRLSEPLSVAEATLMKFGHWFASLDSWPGDLVLACSCEGSSLELIVSPKDGAMVLVRTNRRGQDTAIGLCICLRTRRGWNIQHRGRPEAGRRRRDDCLVVSMKASWNLATPKDDKKPPEPTVLLADVHSETAVGRLLRLDACFEPSALLAMAHAKDAKYVVRDGVLTISGDEEAMNLKINISSGRLLELSPAKNCDRQTEGLRFERGALDRRWAEVRKVTAGHTNLFDPKRPAHSFGQYLALDDGLWKVLARANAAVGSSKAPDDPVALRDSQASGEGIARSAGRRVGR